MLSSPGVALAVLLWLGLLFLVASWGERHDWSRGRPRLDGVVYALSLAVYCTSWTFYGTVSQGAAYGWWLPPTFLGTILLYLFGSGFLDRLLNSAKAVNATSVADFIASRFGQNSGLAALITAVVVVGMLPYIALQLKAVAMSYSALIAGAAQAPAWQDSAFYVALVLAAFAMLFGTRRSSAIEGNRGLVLSMAFEAVFKLAALLLVGAFVVWRLYDGPADLWQQWQAASAIKTEPRPAAYLTLSALGALAMFTLPHQFHVGVVECADRRQLRTARWLFPLFLLLISLPIWPLAAAGSLRLLPAGLPSDLFVLGLPLTSGAKALSVLALLGGIAAATGMVILASLSISIMVGNHWITPLLLRRGWPARGWLGDVRRMRRFGIASVLLLGYVYSRALGSLESLAEIGAQSFSALAQLAPAVALAVYRPNVSPRAIGAGVLAGFALWAYVLIVPLLWPALAAADPGWLSPSGLFGLAGFDPLSRAVWTSLALNLLVMAGVARWWPGEANRAQAHPLEPGQLRAIARRFLAPARLAELAKTSEQGSALEARVAHELTAVIGAASTRLLLDAARAGSDRQIEEVASIVGDATQAARFSQQVLGAALENMSQGISVVDAELRLVAWNRRYAELFAIPPELLQVGRPINDLIHHALARVEPGQRDDADSLQRRLDHLRAGTAHLAERRFPDGSIYEIRGTPMAGGGFVTTFTDVTAFRRTEAELTAIAATLEQRVKDRTAAAESARAEAEQANLAKSRLLAAITHDLAQPLNAARLFGHALTRRSDDPRDAGDLRSLLGALESAEALLGGLLDISRLGAGAMQPRCQAFRLDELLEPLIAEFRALAAEKGLELRAHIAPLWIWSDPQLLRRVVQNFLSNAVRYTERGGLLLACRRRGQRVQIQVWDSGPGIDPADRALIYQEFRRLERGGRGLGLGLAIADRIARLLDCPITLRSTPGRGSMFAIDVPLTDARPAAPVVEAEEPAAPRLRVLVVDNDSAVLGGMRSLLETWGCDVRTASSRHEAFRVLADFGPDLLMLDYHLDAGDTGLDLRNALGEAVAQLPCVLITADHDAATRERAEAAGCIVLHKPVKPLALKSVMARLGKRQPRH